MCNESNDVQRCATCGCTDNDACRINGLPCCWIFDDLCSGCAGIEEIVVSPAGVAWLEKLLDKTAELLQAGIDPTYEPCHFQQLELGGEGGEA